MQDQSLKKPVVDQHLHNFYLISNSLYHAAEHRPFPVSPFIFIPYNFDFSARVMATTTRLFQAVRDLFETMKVQASQPNRIPTWLNRTNAFFFLSMVLMIVTSVAYLVFKAKTIQQFTDPFYVASTCVAGSVICVHILVFQIANISGLIVTFEEFIEKRKFSFF